MHRRLYILLILLSGFNLRPVFSQPFTPRIIYDFAPGDEFHYTESVYVTYGIQSGFSYLILDKSYNADSTSISYIVRVNRYLQNLVPGTGTVQDTTYTTETDTLIYSDLDSNIKYLMAYNVASYPAYQNWYQSLAAMDSSCLSSLSFSEQTDSLLFGGIYVDHYRNEINLTFNSCMNSTRAYAASFGRGTGLLYASENISGGPYYSHYTNLVYFKKGNITAGTPVGALMTGLTDKTFKTVSVFPNPAADFIYLSNFTLPPGGSYEILDFHGRIVSQVFITQGTNRIPVSDLDNGMYVLKIKDRKAIRFMLSR